MQSRQGSYRQLASNSVRWPAVLVVRCRGMHVGHVRTSAWHIGVVPYVVAYWHGTEPRPLFLRRDERTVC
jgi:hypothetical protein